MFLLFCIVDNDDFKVDTLTGNSQKAHRTNVMFVQPECIENKSDRHNTDSAPKTKSEISKELEGRAADLTHVTPYRLPRGASSEPPIREVCDSSVAGTVSQKKRLVIHALARFDSDGTRPEADSQQVPA